MRRSWPLPTTNPEFSVLECPGYYEYRIENWRLARDGTGKIISRASNLSWLDAFVAVVLSYLFLKAARFYLVSSLSATAFCLWKKCNQVLSESIVVLPSLGIQLETRRGIPLFPKPLSTSRSFIPLGTLHDVIINEGLRRWDVRYYLAFVRRKHLDDADSTYLEVAYENVLPYHEVLVHIYESLRVQIPKTMTIRLIPC